MLFTDIKASSDGVRTLGADKWEAVLERHTGIIREALASNGGFEVRSEGDSFFAVFTSHSAALGGQVLVSDTTESLVRDLLSPGLTLRDLGEHRFKDLVRPQRIYQLVVDGLPESFPTLRSLDSTPNNLPTQTTTFIGRERELARAVERLETGRLLTLTGPGGSGKTRLALHLAADLLERYLDGVWLVELAPVTDPTGVAPSLAAAAHIGERPGRPTLDTISEWFRSRRVLLVLDNCEPLKI